jgi:hypothetical protein
MLAKRFEEAIRHYWLVRATQRQRQVDAGRVVIGTRSAVTGGAQMSALADLVAQIFIDEGFPEDSIQRGASLELPGYREPFFAIDEIFRGASYKKRYEIFCRRLVRERLYDASCFATASEEPNSPVHQPAEDLTFAKFAAAIRGRAKVLLELEDT